MKKVIVSLAIVAFSLQAHAQMNNWRMTYDMAIPMGEMSDFISRDSWRGISIDSRFEIKPNITVGFLIGWQVFAQRFDNITEEFNNGNAAVHGTQFRFINTFPMQGNVHYSFGPDFGIRPWVGMGLGTSFSDQRLQVGFYEVRRAIWSLTFTPQAGIDIPIDHSTAFTLSARYNYFLHNNQPFNYSFIVFSAGFKFSYM